MNPEETNWEATDDRAATVDDVESLRTLIEDLRTLFRRHEQRSSKAWQAVLRGVQDLGTQVAELPAAPAESGAVDVETLGEPADAAPDAVSAAAGPMADAPAPSVAPAPSPPDVMYPPEQPAPAPMPAQMPAQEQPLAPAPPAPGPPAPAGYPQGVPAPQPAAAPAAAPVTSDEWAAILLDAELLANPLGNGAAQELIGGLRYGEPAAEGLIGQLLVFRASTADRMAQLLKDIGEAYYRWRPESAAGPDGFRDALVAFLQRRCEAVGVGNRIEIVRPGDRYDPARHHAKSRGMEVVEVYGWVVLRENKKVYTKATVAVR